MEKNFSMQNFGCISRIWNGNELDREVWERRLVAFPEVRQASKLPHLGGEGRRDVQQIHGIKNEPTPASFIVYCWSFQTNSIITILRTNICEQGQDWS